jgi:hypothetical protein
LQADHTAYGSEGLQERARNLGLGLLRSRKTREFEPGNMRERCANRLRHRITTFWRTDSHPMSGKFPLSAQEGRKTRPRAVSAERDADERGFLWTSGKPPCGKDEGGLVVF